MASKRYQNKPHSAVYIGDYNSHHELWKYADSNANGEKLLGSMEIEHLSLVFGAKQSDTIRSAVWRRDYTLNYVFCHLMTETVA